MPPPPPLSFEGSCAFERAALTQPGGVVGEQRPASATVLGEGTCNGAPASIDLRLAGVASCTYAQLTGPGTLTTDGNALPIAARIVFDAAGATSVEVRGEDSGVGAGEATLGFTSPGGVCADGSHETGTVTLAFTTQAPLTSAVPVTLEPKVTFKPQRAAAVARRGAFRVRCTVPAAGLCRVQVTSGTFLLAQGIAEAGDGGSVRVRVKLTGRGEARLDGGRQLVARIVAEHGGVTAERRIVFRGQAKKAATASW